MGEWCYVDLISSGTTEFVDRDGAKLVVSDPPAAPQIAALAGKEGIDTCRDKSFDCC